MDSSKISQLHYYTALNKISIVINENTYKVDGIGGITWDGSIILSRFIESLQLHFKRSNSDSKLKIIELGAGSGLVGIASAVSLLDYSIKDISGIEECVEVILTDREVDLINENISIAQQQNVMSKNLLNVLSSETLEWSDNLYTKLGDSVFNRLHTPDIIFGAEIACLRKQQPLLVNTIQQLTVSNSDDNCIIVLSFDGIPPYKETSTNKLLYESKGTENE